MKKILDFYDWLAGKLCRVSGDKWTHAFVCLVLTFIVARLDMWLWGREAWTAAVTGAVAAMTIGLVKEAVDEFRSGDLDIGDLRADLAGCVAGMLLAAL